MLDENQELKNKIQELNKRVEFLEKQEQKRKIKKQLKIGFQILKIIVILAIIFVLYSKINNTLIKPYKQKVDYVEEKVSSVESFVQEKWESIQKYNLFNK